MSNKMNLRPCFYISMLPHVEVQCIPGVTYEAVITNSSNLIFFTFKNKKMTDNFLSILNYVIHTENMYRRLNSLVAENWCENI